MVRPPLEDVPPFLWGEIFNWAAYLKNHLPHSALKGKTLFKALLNTKPTISHLCLFLSECFVHRPEEKRTVGSKLDARAVEGHVVSYTESSHMFRIYIPSQRKVDTFVQVKFKPSSSYTSVDIHIPSLPNEADNLLTTPIPPRPDTPITLPKTTSAELQITLPPLSQQFAEYEQFFDEDFEPERVPGESSAGPSTPPRQTSTTTSSAPKSS